MANGKTEEKKAEEKPVEAKPKTKFSVRINASDLEKLGIETRESREVTKAIRKKLGLPESTRAPGKNAKLKAELGLPETATFREVRDALVKKSGLDKKI